MFFIHASTFSVSFHNPLGICTLYRIAPVHFFSPVNLPVYRGAVKFYNLQPYTPPPPPWSVDVIKGSSPIYIFSADL